ncbi:ParB/RepB/Spo0J family partition protein [Amycolatopsis albispora]|uniref:ParB/RepB/Spo0J family partition protein n=1 Tax=Amycolatopsis albispora TaxID=1804986 RepID=UPI001F283C03|nr:ParB/RepB/Spo0J family partition protein [Amycolatopsis albispora]
MLRPSDSPRLDGENREHAKVLAESEAMQVPVLVHRATMRVIDGMHRVHAASLRGDETILARFFDGTAADAFVLGVKANITHGLPLSLADRRAAAMRIIASHPQWSDRMIATTTGLAAKTVSMIRRCAGGDGPALSVRIGRDGRARPVNCADGRLRASVLLREQPTASLRRIATEAGISLSTVRDVRERLIRGEHPVPPRQRRKALSESDDRPGRAQPEVAAAARKLCAEKGEGQESLLLRLKQDPSLRFSETGRTLIRLLSLHAVGEQERKQLLDAVPQHCRNIVAELAHACAESWQEFASWLDEQDASVNH